MSTFPITWRPLSVVCRPLTSHILIFSCETAQPNELKLGRKNLWKVRSQNCIFYPDPFTIMTTAGNYCFWLIDFYWAYWASNLDVQSGAVHEINGQKYGNQQAEGMPTDFIGKKRCRNLRMTPELQLVDNSQVKWNWQIPGLCGIAI